MRKIKVVALEMLFLFNKVHEKLKTYIHSVTESKGNA